MTSPQTILAPVAILACLTVLAITACSAVDEHRESGLQEPVQLSDTTKAEAELKAIATQAWNHYFPLLQMDWARRSVHKLKANSWQHFERGATHSDEFPNLDFLLSEAWVDVTHAPVELMVPPDEQHFFLLHVEDYWSNTLATELAENRQHSAARYVFVPEADVKRVQEELRRWPEDVKLIKSPTDLLRVRLLTEITPGPAKQFRQTISLRRSQLPWIRKSSRHTTEYPAMPEEMLEGLANGEPPADTIARLDAQSFFSYAIELQQSMRASLPAELHEPFQRLGIHSDARLIWSGLTDRQRLALQAATESVHEVRAESQAASKRLHNGWLYAQALDKTASEPRIRALRSQALGSTAMAVAFAGLEGNSLSGKRGRRYQIHFAENGLPPTNGVWSITAYDRSGQPVDNPINRHVIDSRSKLQFAADGSLSLYLSASNPHGEHSPTISNWLPIPEDEFVLQLRVYSPTAAIGPGGWSMPALAPY